MFSQDILTDLIEKSDLPIPEPLYEAEVPILRLLHNLHA